MASGPGNWDSSLAPLTGFRVGVAASWRREEQVLALRSRGARVVGGPVAGALPLVELEALQAVTDEVLETPPDVVLLASGPALETWLGAAEGSGRDQALRQVLARARVVLGPGPAVLAGVAADAGVRRVAVQVDGRSGGGELTAALRAAGMDVVEVPVPATPPPEEAAPALALVEAVADRRVEAVTFTSAGEVRSLAGLASDAGRDADLLTALSGEVLPVCLGRSCAQAATGLGMAGVVKPDSARLGAMVEILAARLAATARPLVLGGVEVVIQGAVVVVAGKERWLAERERAVLAELARRPGTVVAKGEILRRVWRSDGVEGADRHAVEVVVARLRRRLGPAGAGLQTVPRRGYLLATGEGP